MTESGQTPRMVELISNEQYWNRPDLVALYRDLDGALDYEADAIRDAAGRASSTGPVRSVHVVGVGVGRELEDIRRITGGVIHAWDMSAPMVDACSRRIDQAGWNDVTVRQATIQQLPELLAEPADLVVGLSAVLCYDADPDGRRQNLRALRSMCRTGAGIAVVVQQRHGRPGWAAYFATLAMLERAHLRHRGVGNRPSRYGEAAVLLHHYGRAELGELMDDARFTDHRIESLRDWAEPDRRRVPRRSPNPLIATATAM